MDSDESDLMEKTALEYLDDFYSVIRRKAADDPKFAHDLVDALGANVTFEGEDIVGIVDPVALVEKRDSERFKAIFAERQVKQIKAILTSNNLAEPSEMAGKKKPELLDLLYDSAKAAAEARS
jgi:hypothetical protein